MQNNAAGTSCEAGRMFMVIMPGKYKLTIKYYVRDKETGVSGVITKTFGEFQYNANGYYDMPAALSIRNYGDDYYAGMPSRSTGSDTRTTSRRKREYQAAIILPVRMATAGTTLPKTRMPLPTRPRPVRMPMNLCGTA